MNCRACNRPSTEGSVYCPYHSQAYTRLEETYPQWRKALDYTWTEYLEKAAALKGTGRWAKEVATDILKQARAP